MKWRSYKRWGFKDPAKEDKYWRPETHPMYMGEARQIPGYIEEWNPNQA